MKSAFVRILMAFMIMAVFGAEQIISAADKPKIPLNEGRYVREDNKSLSMLFEHKDNKLQITNTSYYIIM